MPKQLAVVANSVAKASAQRFGAAGGATALLSANLLSGGLNKPGFC